MPTRRAAVILLRGLHGRLDRVQSATALLEGGWTPSSFTRTAPSAGSAVVAPMYAFKSAGTQRAWRVLKLQWSLARDGNTGEARALA